MRVYGINALQIQQLPKNCDDGAIYVINNVFVFLRLELQPKV